VPLAHCVCRCDAFHRLILEAGLRTILATERGISSHCDVIGVAERNCFLVMGEQIVLDPIHSNWNLGILRGVLESVLIRIG